MMLLLASLALAADPSALRELDGAGVLAEVGTETIGVAGAVGSWALSGHYAPGSHAAVAAGQRRPLVGAERTWGIDGLLAGGLVGLLATPGAALVGTGELRMGARNERGRATFGVVVPLALRVDVPPQLAAPIGLELQFAARLGPVWLGCRGQIGATLATGGPPTGRAAASGFVQIAP